MKITFEIRRAIVLAASAYDTKAEFASAVGVHAPNVSRWIAGSVSSMSDDSWHKLRPHIEPYLPEGVTDEVQPESATEEVIISTFRGLNAQQRNDFLEMVNQYMLKKNTKQRR